MKPTRNNINLGLLLVISLFTVCILTGCGIGKSAKEISKSFDEFNEMVDRRAGEAINSFDKAISALAQESVNWQSVITNLESEVVNDVQSTIRGELQDIAKIAIQTTGAEVRCNEEFFKHELRNELIRMRNNFVSGLNAQLSQKKVKFQFRLLEEEPSVPFICDITPSYYDVTLSPERRKRLDIYGFNLRELPITVKYRSYGLFSSPNRVGYEQFQGKVREHINNLRSSHSQPNQKYIKLDKSMVFDQFKVEKPWMVFNYDISNSLSIVSDFHAVLDLTQSGANLPPNAYEIAFSWNNKVQAAVPIITDMDLLPCETREDIINAGSMDIVPIPIRTGSIYIGVSPTDFHDLGPCMILKVQLFVDDNRKSIIARVTFDAYACSDNFNSECNLCPEFYKSEEIPIYNVQKDEETIIGFDVLPEYTDYTIDTSTDPYLKPIPGSYPINSINYVGDAPGDDNGKTKATITFSQIKVKIKTCYFN